MLFYYPTMHIIPFFYIDDQQFQNLFYVHFNTDYGTYLQYKQMQFCPEIAYVAPSENKLHTHDDGELNPNIVKETVYYHHDVFEPFICNYQECLKFVM